MRATRKLILCVVLLWLPLQGFTAVAMPFCRSTTGHWSQPTEREHEEQCPHQHGAQGRDGTDRHAHAPMDVQCNDCGSCQLACAPAVPCKTVEIPTMSIRTLRFGESNLNVRFIPDPPNPPPLSIAG
jgi:hypothetical protein